MRLNDFLRLSFVYAPLAIAACGDDSTEGNGTTGEDTGTTGGGPTTADSVTITASTTSTTTTGMDTTATTTGMDTTATTTGMDTTDGTDDGTTGDTTGETTGGQMLECADEDLGSTVPQTASGNLMGTGDDVDLSCSGNGGGNDYIYQFTASEAGVYVFDTLGSDLDSALGLISECGGDELACNDDIDPDGNFQSLVLGELAADQTIGIIVDSYGGEEDAYDLNVSYHGEPLSHDICGGSGMAGTDCTDAGGSSMPHVDTLSCPSLLYIWDLYEIDVQQDDCLWMSADNIDVNMGPSGNDSFDLRAVIMDPDGDVVLLDDEIDCSDPTIGGDFGCPEGGMVMGSAGMAYIGIATYGDPNCPDGNSYTLNVSINGTDVDLGAGPLDQDAVCPAG